MLEMQEWLWIGERKACYEPKWKAVNLITLNQKVRQNNRTAIHHAATSNLEVFSGRLSSIVISLSHLICASILSGKHKLASGTALSQKRKNKIFIPCLL
jgi:hypothetical protein